MSKVISNDDKSAYERWELPVVNDGADSAMSHNRLLTAGQIEKIQKQAYDEGYQQGKRFVEFRQKQQRQSEHNRQLPTAIPRSAAAGSREVVQLAKWCVS